MQSKKEYERTKARVDRIKEAQTKVIKRRKPKSVQDEADSFIAAAISHFAAKDIILNKRNLVQIPVLFRNYSHNSGLRGDHKSKVWANVKRQLDEAKASATSDDAEL